MGEQKSKTIENVEPSSIENEQKTGEPKPEISTANTGPAISNAKVTEVPSSDIKATEVSGRKKASPFLSSEVKKEQTEETENSSKKRQHEHIDQITKDNCIFNAVGKLYFKSQKTGKMETRGEGKFLILKDKASMHKLVMIRDLVMLKGCNHIISPNCPLTKATQAKNSWIWTALHDQSDAEKKEDSILYFATFKDEEASKLFGEKYKQAQNENLDMIEAKKDRQEKK